MRPKILKDHTFLPEIDSPRYAPIRVKPGRSSVELSFGQGSVQDPRLFNSGSAAVEHQASKRWVGIATSTVRLMDHPARELRDIALQRTSAPHRHPGSTQTEGLRKIDLSVMRVAAVRGWGGG